MFTGIVQTQATLVAVEEKDQFRHFTIATEEKFLSQLQIGASIAINGCCLTVVQFALANPQFGGQATVQFDVIDETLRLTNLGALQPGDTVNFERSLRVGDEIGGHQVSGHIHTCATLVEVNTTANNWEMWLEFDAKWSRYVFAKGFISVNGASLTIGQVRGQQFSLHLIPETLRLTNLGNAAVGTQFNLEFDQQTMTIVETVERVLAARQ